MHIYNVWGLPGNLSDLTVVLSRYDLLLCSEIVVWDMHHASGLLVPGFGLVCSWIHKNNKLTKII